MFVLFYTPSSMLGAVLGILLSVTPLAPIFRLLSFCFNAPTVMLENKDLAALTNETEDVGNIIHELFVNPTLDFEQAIMSIFSRYPLRDRSSFIIQSPSFPWAKRSTTSDDLHEVIPWILSLILFVVVPVLMKVSEAVRNQGIGRTAKAKHKACNTLALEKCLGMSKMKVTKDDSTNTCSSEDVDQESSTSILRVPVPGTILRTDANGSTSAEVVQRRDFVGSCAICLSSFKAGDMIVWSSSCQCHDVFHELCFMAWAQRKEKPSCPCCRQDFVKRELMDEVIIAASNEGLIFSSNSDS